MFCRLTSVCFVLQTLTFLCEGWSGPPVYKVNNVKNMKIDSHPEDVQSLISHFLMKASLKDGPLISIKPKKVEPSRLFSPFLLRGEPISTPKLGQKLVPESCGGDDQFVNVSSILIKPWPVFFPGQLTIGFDITFAGDIPDDALLSGSIVLQYKAASNWINIPCIGNIGSCEYQDLCSLMEMIVECPREFQENNIPCKCPFNKGQYKLPELSVEVDASVFLSGQYKAQVQLKEASKGQLACYVLEFTIG